MLNLVVVNFPCVPVQLCLMNIQIDTPHTPEGFFVVVVFVCFWYSGKAIVFFF